MNRHAEDRAFDNARRKGRAQQTQVPPAVVIAVVVAVLIAVGIALILAASQSTPKPSSVPVNQPSPANPNPAAAGLTDNSSCSGWASSNAAERKAYVRATVGDVNLRWRITGLTAICAIDAQQGHAASEAIGQNVRLIASDAPNPVPNGLRVPRTLDATDPHQCLERMAGITSGKNADEPPDCVAMGF